MRDFLSILKLPPALVLFLALLPVPATADWLPFTLKDGYITFGVEIANQPAVAMLDSGAEGNMISSRFVRNYGQDFHRMGKVNARGINATEEIPLYGNIPVSIFGTDITLDYVAVGPFVRADLLLGSAFFNLGLLQIDYPGSRLRFLDRKAVDLRKEANVPMKRASNSSLPAIQISIGGRKAWLLLDTGSNGGLVLKRSFASDRGLIDESTQSREVITAGINSIATYERFALDSVKIGPYELESVITSVPAEGQSSNLGSRSYILTGTRINSGVRTVGLIGFDVLKHFIVTVDYKTYRVHFYVP